MCVVLQHGGVTFLLMYTVMLGLLGWPLLVLEAVLGQYSSLAPGHLYRHLCPLLAGLGIAVCLQAAVRALLDLGVLMWAALTCYALFSRQEIADGFFARDILAQVSTYLYIYIYLKYLHPRPGAAQGRPREPGRAGRPCRPRAVRGLGGG